MENLLNYLQMSLEFQIEHFIEAVKAKAIQVGIQHDGLLTVLTLCSVFYLIMVSTGHLWKNKKKKKKGKIQRVLTRSMSIGVLHGGELALERLVDYHQAKANVQLLDVTETELDSLLNEDLPNFKKLQRCIAKLEMSGKESKAVKKLESAIRKAQLKGKPHEAYEFEMLLVESLIYQGDFIKALSYECLNDEFITDARRPLYKAIIYLSLGYTEEEAKEFWREFKRIREHMKRSYNTEDVQLFEITTDFDKFMCIVKSLGEDIKQAKAKANKNK
ncbi:PREDICTED: uncharacterized protein LOC109217204 [Nicotiana attenuata]|uniref:Uncharacterized protein n=1 Tax=Nicotiana attenuata TaxID=49451 RepID=A0A1J6KUG6_NICAT|nr:PREDICTED: uncharacterized protein LOC109217204 [Nicotiana attenuata]OIT22737.1 hypothetical protein A4A49_34414 [Nicotiana attenuata]